MTDNGYSDEEETAESPKESDDRAVETGFDTAADGATAESAREVPESETATSFGEERLAGEETSRESEPAKESDEVYCWSCGGAIRKEAEICPECGVRQQETGPVGEKNPGISAIASLVIPGAGQIYNGQFTRGIVWFVGAGMIDVVIAILAIVLTVILIGPLFLLLIPVVNVVAAYDAYKQAEKINAGEITV